MASTWWVKPPTASNGDGTSYATAWAGIGNVVWASVLPGDTLMLCGSHLYESADFALGKDGSAGSVITLDGSYAADPGSLNFGASSHLLSIARSYWTFTDFSLNPGTSACSYIAGSLNSLTFRRLSLLNGGLAGLQFGSANGTSYTDILIDACNFSGSFVNGSNATGAIHWSPSVALSVSTLTRFTVSGCNFTDVTAGRASIHLRPNAGVGAGTLMTDVQVINNTHTRCYGFCIEVNDAFSSTLNHSSGLIVRGNKATSCGLGPVSSFGGHITIAGFGPSSSLGNPVVERNQCSNVTGNNGAIDLFYGTYIVRFNTGDGIAANSIDGNGILFDNGNDSCEAYGNEYSNLSGCAVSDYSGFGLMILNSTNIKAFGNVVRNARGALHIGNKQSGQSGTFYNNTFTGMSKYGVQLLSTASPSTVTFKSNVITASSASATPVSNAAAAWSGEDYNNFYGFGSPSGHTFGSHTTTTTPDITSTGLPSSAGSNVLTAGNPSDSYVRGFDGKQCKGYIGAFGQATFRH